MVSQAINLKQRSQFIDRVINRLIAPSAALEQQSDQRRARLLSALLFPVTAATLAGTIANPTPEITFALISLVIAYVLSRTRYYTIAAVITVSVLAFPSFLSVATATAPTSDQTTTSMIWVVLPLVLAGLVLDPVVALAVGGLMTAGMVVLPSVNPQVEFSFLVGPLGFTIPIILLTTMAATIRNRDAKQIEQAQTDLQAESVRLAEANRDLEAARKEAEEANRVKSEFLSTMSHELRTPLNAILGYQGILELMGQLDDESLDMVQRTQANARRLLELINAILDISRIEAGRMDLVPDELNVRELVARLETQMQVLSAEKNLAFHTAVDPSVPATIYADQDALSKIMTNLLSNAFKFTEEGRVDLKLAARNGDLVISVRDTGIGIPLHMHQIIFERFRQADSSSTREHQGTGLGLNIAQQVTTMMGGSITVDSTVGEGSTFTVTFPVKTEQAVAESMA